MYLLAGIKTQFYSDIWCGQTFCPKCGKPSDFHLIKVKNVGSIFFIPFIFVTSGRLMVCDSCGTAVKIEKKEYEIMKKEREVKLYNYQFPLYIIQRDYNPKALKIKLKIGILIFFAIITVMSLGVGALFLIPPIISFAKARKKYGVYKKMIADNSISN